jgi:hypothetical protein
VAGDGQARPGWGSGISLVHGGFSMRFQNACPIPSPLLGSDLLCACLGGLAPGFCCVRDGRSQSARAISGVWHGRDGDRRVAVRSELAR